MRGIAAEGGAIHMSFFNELKRRNVFKVGIAYVVVAWLVAQVQGSHTSARIRSS